MILQADQTAIKSAWCFARAFNISSTAQNKQFLATMTDLSDSEDFEERVTNLLANDTRKDLIQLVWYLKAFHDNYAQCFTFDFLGINASAAKVKFLSQNKAIQEATLKLAAHPLLRSQLYYQDLKYLFFHSPLMQPLRFLRVSLLISLSLCVLLLVLVGLNMANPVAWFLGTIGLSIGSSFAGSLVGATLIGGFISLVVWPTFGILASSGEMLATTLHFMAQRTYFNKTYYKALPYFLFSSAFYYLLTPIAYLINAFCDPINSLMNIVGRDASLVKKHVIESDYFPTARLIRHDSLWQRVKDTYYTLNGHEVKRASVLTSTHGVLDFFCFGIPHLCWSWMRNFFEDCNSKIKTTIGIVLCTFALPINAIKAVIAATLTVALFPIIGLVHLSLRSTVKKHQQNIHQVKVYLTGYKSYQPSYDKSDLVTAQMKPQNLNLFNQMHQGPVRLMAYTEDLVNHNKVTKIRRGNNTQGMPSYLFLSHQSFNHQGKEWMNKPFCFIKTSTLDPSVYYSLLRTNYGGVTLPIERSGNLDSLVNKLDRGQVPTV